MALTATLKFGDATTDYSNVTGYPVIDFHLHFARHHEFSYPDANACCESIELIVETPGNTNLSIYDWYIEGKPSSGCITFELPSSENNQNRNKRIESSKSFTNTVLSRYNDCGKRKGLLNGTETSD